MKKYKNIILSDFLCQSFIPSNSDLSDFLDKNSLSFPQDYLDFLLQINGGTVWTKQTALFEVKFPRSVKTMELREIFSFRLGDSIIGQPHIWNKLNSLRPKFIYEFGAVDNDSYVCLLLDKSENFGKIYFYNINKLDINNKSSVYDVLNDKYFISLNDSFSEFISSLRCIPTNW